MSLGHSPRIVTSGLVYCLDAANLKSYPGSGTTWTDLATAKNASLQGSPSFNTGNAGYINFTSAGSQYANSVTVGDLSTWTVEVFVRFTASYSSKVSMVIGGQYNGSNKINFTIGTNNAPTNYNIAVGFFDGSWRSTTGVAYATNTWVHIVGTYDGSTIKQFTNGGQVQSLNYIGTPASGGEIRINRRWDDVVSIGNLFDVNIGTIRIYNRALSNTEISQNFNANSGRYGL
jgi:hypothetical protein